MSNDPKLVIFGSFTEEETQIFQKQICVSGKTSPESTCLQFGLLKLDCTLSPRDSKSFIRPTVFSTPSKSSSAPNSVVKEKLNALQTKEIQKPSSAFLNRSISECHLIRCSAENGKATEFLTAASVDTDLVHEVEDVDGESLKDVTSTVATENSSENEICLDIPVKVCLEENFQISNLPKISNEAVALKPLLPCGLVNSGNLCFLNATLQALLSCPPFVGLLQNLRMQNIPVSDFPTLHAFVEFISAFDMPDHLSLKKNDQSVVETGKAFSPVMFEAVLRSFTPDVADNISGRPRQEDAQEFLSFVMDRMHEDLLKLGGHFANSNGGASYVISSEEDNGWETVGPKNKTSVTRIQNFVPSSLSDIFGGQLRSVVKARGNKASATIEPFLLLHLDISHAAVNTIEDALRLYSAPETLEGYKAAAEKSITVSASKSVKIQKVSKILILHLMRFSYGKKGIAKLNKPVRFSPELVLSRDLLVSPASEGRRYELVSTITHHGVVPSRGHYTADAKYSNGTWLRYNDASVTSVAISEVLHDQSYVLFYKQLSLE